MVDRLAFEEKKMNEDTLKEFKSYLWKRWLLDVTIRTIKTGAETMLAYISVGMMIQEISWLRALSVTAVSMLYTILINIYRIASDLDNANKHYVENSVESGEK